MSPDQLPELESRPQGRREWSGWLTSLVLPIGFVVALVGLLLYLQTSGGNETKSPYGTVALDAAHNPTGEKPDASVGRAAPDFLLESTDEELFHLSDMQGTPVLVSFFTTWCVDCRTQVSLLTQASEEHGENLVILLVNLREAQDRLTAFLDGYGVEFPVLFDRDGDVGSTWRVGGRNQPLPASFFIDDTGVVRKVVEGPLSAADLDDGLSLILEDRN